MADLCVSWCLCHTIGVMHQWRCACWFTDVCNDAPAVIMMLLSSKYLNTCAIFVVRFTLSLTSGFPHSQAKKSAPSSGAGNHDVQWHSLYRSRSGNNTFIEFIHSFIHSLFFLQHRFRHKVTAILCTNIYTLDYYWNIVFDNDWNIDLIKYCHVWCAFSCLFINGEKYDQVKKDRKTKGWVHHNFVTSENVVTSLLITYIFSFFPQNLWCTHQIFLPKIANKWLFLASNCPQITLNVCIFLQVDWCKQNTLSTVFFKVLLFV